MENEKIDRVVTKKIWDQADGRIYTKGEVKLLKPVSYPLKNLEKLESEWNDISSKRNSIELLESKIEILKEIRVNLNKLYSIIEIQVEMVEKSKEAFEFLDQSYEDSMLNEAVDIWDDYWEKFNQLVSKKSIDKLIELQEELRVQKRRDQLLEELEEL